MKYSKEFIEFVERGIDNYYIGTGCPNANILFVGKEAAIPKNNVNEIKEYKKNAENWNKHITNGSCEILNYPVTKNHQFRKEKSWGKNTWSKYQKLKNIIFQEDTKNHINFLEKVFTTEINDAPDKNTSTADKSNLNIRKKIFKQSKFIQQFPVIVLACSNYIKNNEYVREIDDIFDVTFHEETVYSKGNWFYTHYNEDKSKLVIHTRQLSANVRGDLLNDMGKVIRNHLKNFLILDKNGCNQNIK